jgi:hypothetical protein
MISDRKTEILVDERTRRVKREIEEWDSKSKPHQTFCVSAKDHMENSLGYLLGDLHRLPISVRCSGIVDLKQYLTGIAAESQKQDLTRHITNTIPLLLTNLESAVVQCPGTPGSNPADGFDLLVSVSFLIVLTLAAEQFVRVAKIRSLDGLRRLFDVALATNLFPNSVGQNA